MAVPCDGLRVIDVSQGMAGPLAAMILADYGAEVIKVEPPSGDWARPYPGFHMWNRGKRGVVLDLKDAEARRRFHELVRGADVVIEAYRPGVTERLGIDYATLAAINDRLIYCSITGFGAEHALSRIRTYEGTVSAVDGRMVGLDRLSGAIAGQNREHPIFSAAPIASYGAAQLAAQGILAAAYLRRRTGRGQRVDTSLAQGEAAFFMRQEMVRHSTGEELVLPPAARHKGIMLAFMTAECSDGRYIQMCARQDAQFKNWMAALGLDHLLDDQRFAGAPLAIATVEAVDELEAIIREKMSAGTAEEWIALFTDSFDVGADPFLTADEFLVHPQMLLNDRIVELDDPELGRTRQIGPLVLMSDTPGCIDTPAPLLDQHADLLHWTSPAASPDLVPSEATGSFPLSGVTVLELGYFVAAPLAATMLAELGARVIKVEPMDGDPGRRLGVQNAKFFDGKQSIAADLRSPEGKEILQRLLGEADCLLTSFRPGVPERLGFDYATAAAMNPRLVYLYGGSYGSKGPQSHRTAYHSTPAALTGAGAVQAGVGNAPVDDSFPDAASGLGAATALMLGLNARDRTGRGQYMETSMLVSGGYVVSNDLVRYAGAPERPYNDREQHGLHACYRLYACSDGWIFVSAFRRGECVRLLEAVDRKDLLGRPIFDGAGNVVDDAALAKELTELFASASAASWLATLHAADVAATAVSHVPLEVFFREAGYLSPAEHPDYPPYWKLPLKWSFSASQAQDAPTCGLGEQTDRILHELEYSDDEISELHALGRVRSWVAPSV